MTPKEKLLARLRTIIDIPDNATIESTYAGIRQRQAGAWSWYLSVSTHHNIGSFSPVTELLKAERLAVVRDRRASSRVVYDIKDVGADLGRWGAEVEPCPT